jgi:hypothetical protein
VCAHRAHLQLLSLAFELIQLRCALRALQLGILRFFFKLLHQRLQRALLLHKLLHRGRWCWLLVAVQQLDGRRAASTSQAAKHDEHGNELSPWVCPWTRPDARGLAGVAVAGVLEGTSVRALDVRVVAMCGAALSLEV